MFGAPAFFVGDEMFWGNDRLQFVEVSLKGSMLPEPFRSVFLPIYSEGSVTSSTALDSSSASGANCVPFGIACSANRVRRRCAASAAVCVTTVRDKVSCEAVAQELVGDVR